MRESVGLAHEILTLDRAVGLPEEIVWPARRLDAFIAIAARVSTDMPSVQQRHRRGQLVPLRIVDGVARHDREVDRSAGDGPIGDRIKRSHHRSDRVLVQRLLRPVHGEQLAETRVGIFAVDELESRGRLHVGDVQVGEVGDARQHLAGTKMLAGRSVGQVIPELMRLAGCGGDRAVRSPRAASQDIARHQPPLMGQRRIGQASIAAFSSLAISTGSVRSDSLTRVPAVMAPTSDVGICASTVMSPRSTVTRLVAPRNTVDMTLPTSGPGLMSPSAFTDTASGRTRAMAGPSVVSGFTRGKRLPRTSTSPPLTTPVRRLVRPTNSATNGVAGRE